MESYRTPEEARYYGSDLNKWVNKNCNKQMTAINIDLLMYKRSKRKMRIIESKHKYEEIPASQMELLRILAKWVKPLIDATKVLDFRVYIVTADPPYTEARIVDLSTDIEYITVGDDMRKWFEFEIDLTDANKYVEPQQALFVEYEF